MLHRLSSCSSRDNDGGRDQTESCAPGGESRVEGEVRAGLRGACRQMDSARPAQTTSSAVLRPAQRLRTWCAHQGGRLTLAKGGTTVSKWIVTLLAAASLWVAACADAKLVTWTLRDVTFDDGGK